MQFACCFLGVAPPRPPMKEGLLSRPPGGPYPGRGGMAMHAPRPLLQPSPMAGGCVLMVYGLHEHKMNCDRVFNILCCYGNVLKVWKLPETFKVDMYTMQQCTYTYTVQGIQRWYSHGIGTGAMQPWSQGLEKFVLCTAVCILPLSTPVQC